MVKDRFVASIPLMEILNLLDEIRNEVHEFGCTLTSNYACAFFPNTLLNPSNRLFSQGLLRKAGATSVADSSVRRQP